MGSSTKTPVAREETVEATQRTAGPQGAYPYQPLFFRVRVFRILEGEQKSMANGRNRVWDRVWMTESMTFWRKTVVGSTRLELALEAKGQQHRGQDLNMVMKPRQRHL